MLSSPILLMALASAPAPIGTVQSPLMGEDAPASRYAVAVCKGNPGACVLQCSGTLIAPNVVVTVRHCTDDLAPPAAVDCRVDTFEGARTESSLFVALAPSTSSEQGTHRVKRIELPTPTAVCGADLALLVLEDVVASSEAAPAIPVLDASWIGSTTTMSVTGFGASTRSKNDTGVRRVMRNVRIACSNASCRDPASLADGEFSSSTGGLCEGDSGAGAFLDGYPGDARVAAILSRASANGDACVGGAFERLDVWGGWLSRQVKKATTEASIAPPEWAASHTVVPASIGTSCNDAEDCASKRCASPNRGRSFQCTEPCRNGACEAGFECIAGGADSFCFRTPPPAEDLSGGCVLAARSTHSAPAGTSAVALACAVVVALLRARRATRK